MSLGIGLDIGTTGCKACVFDPKGNLISRAYREYGMSCDANGKAEQDAQKVWEAAVAVLTEAVATVDKPLVIAISVSVQGDALVAVDSKNRPVYPAILGMDYRSQPQALLCEEKFVARRLFDVTGMRAHPMNTLTKILWLREHQPEAYTAAFRLGTYADYILVNLGAAPVIDLTMASRTMAYDIHQGCWSAEISETFDVDTALFAKPVPSGTIAGTLAPELAKTTGLSTEVKIVTGGHDQTCAALGAGAVKSGRGVVSTGTAEVFSTVLDTCSISDALYNGYYPCYHHANPGKFFTFSLNHSGGILLRWFRDNLGKTDINEAREKGIDPYALITSRISDKPSDLMMLPHFNGSGTPTCDPDSRGVILGLSLNTTRYDIAQAIMEALCFELRLNLETMQQAGITVNDIIAVGGGASSPRWLQMKADILDSPLKTLVCHEAACLGAAMLAMTAAGVYPSVEDAAQEMVKYADTFSPNPPLVQEYQQLMEKYRVLYCNIKQLLPRGFSL
ncbi:MAG: hypothetical protein HQK83_19830 [Fibrobacteria bacterium]|nr:hypothetical protein [Fibrobacteria bacterium]